MLKLVKYHPLFAYSVGDIFEVSEADAKILLDGKYAVEATEDDVLEAEINSEKKPVKAKSSKK
jgi:hypothetical protein